MQEPYALETEIIPSPGTNILDWATMAQKIELVKPFAKVVHIDLLDGKFAPNTTSLDPTPFAAYTKDMVFEAHLMVEDPLQYLKAFADAGFRRFIGQVEKMPDIAEFVARAEMLGEVGLAIDTDTPVEKIAPFLEDVDVAFVMTVKAGSSNQQFLPEMLEKVRQLREKAAFLPIEIDGGMNDQTIIEAKKAGVTRFVTTGYLFGSADCQSQYGRLQQAVESVLG